MSQYKTLYSICTLLALILSSCAPQLHVRKANREMPENYQNQSTDTINTANTPWKDFYSDPNLKSLINQALTNNQELNITMLKIQMAKNEIKARKGEYLPFVHYYAGADIEKVGEYTRNGAVEKNLAIKEVHNFPDPLSNYTLGISASWELDVWKKLRTSKKAAVMEYLATVEGKNFMTTNLIAEIASTYYELLALDNQLAIIKQNLEIQQNALKIVRLQKIAAQTNELAVKRFEAEVLKNKSHQYEVKQDIVTTENKINFLIGQRPQPIQRASSEMINKTVQIPLTGIPSQLLQNRPDIRQAEYELAASKLNVQVARTNFYPSFGIRAGIGLEAFEPKFLTSTPESFLYHLTGDLVGPLINRNAIKAAYKTANTKQLQAIYEYEKVILSAYIEISNGLSNLKNLKQNYSLKNEQVQTLTESIDISIQQFKYARADYMEVLLTQRDALESKIELVETKKHQMLAAINLYRALGGGWR